MHVQLARFEEKRCPMSQDSCAEKVIAEMQKFFPTGEGAVDVRKQVEEKCGRFTKGKTPGKLRGWASFLICTTGGWKAFGPGAGNGRVYFPGTILGIAIRDYHEEVYYSVGRVDL